jgi:hypothetical protein
MFFFESMRRGGNIFGVSELGAGRSKDGLNQDDTATMKKPLLHLP